MWLKFHEEQTGHGDGAGATGWRLIMYEDDETSQTLVWRIERFDWTGRWLIVGIQREVLFHLSLNTSATVSEQHDCQNSSVFSDEIWKKIDVYVKVAHIAFFYWFLKQLDWEELDFPVSSCQSQSDYV